MKEYFVKTLTKDLVLNGEKFSVIKFQKNLTKSGDEYYRIEVGDKTGTIVGNAWKDNIGNIDMEVLKPGQIVNVYAKVEEFKGTPQLNYYSIGKCPEFELADFVKVSDKDPDKLWDEFLDHVNSITDPDIKKLLDIIFNEDGFKNHMKIHPAAERLHHAFRHGLLEHIMEMLDLSEVMNKYYKNVDMSIVKAAIILHDIGKLFELRDDGTTYTRTLEGRLIGHLSLGYEYLIKMLPSDFPEEKALLLKHALLSHHGLLEYGSPVMPKTIEAAIVNGVDDLSSKVRQFERIIGENKENGERFSPYDSFLGREIFLK